MRFSSLARLVTVLAGIGAGAFPAAAQVLPMDMFLPPQRPASTPASISSAAEGFTLSSAPPPAHAFRPNAPKSQVSEPQASAAPEPAKPEPTFAARAPLPPVRPVTPVAQAEYKADDAVVIAAKPIIGAMPGQTAATRIEPLSNNEIVARANAYFTNMRTLVADFTQVGGDGRKLGGTLYLQRPGKLRFEYDPPATLEVIADGTSISVRDKKLLTQDMYFIQQTPLKFLLRDNVNLGQDIPITGITTEAGAVRVSLEDRSTLGGTSRIVLYFDPEVKSLTQWRIVDPQGFQTVVVLNKIDRSRSIDQSLFRIPNAPTGAGSVGR
ncbi:outer-membrane lipoprotein carrier protein LolA [Microvirga terricola]|uniref:Outer membrane lipoprotein carrier protein LolA n=1 Tax=Microvirga terricola TaxID=2719797 RepID=A0ABX0V711_9HYPH|nr:outer-membrane lipoprotein carrier protein LolA [Microvirga terricola]NIX75502.1 outer membrane lipoprotein carrier protein LolA [Microvirga terricola]